MIDQQNEQYLLFQRQDNKREQMTMKTTKKITNKRNNDKKRTSGPRSARV